jgi:asparagine synthase (glutamine-hydrolysing)
MCGIAGSTNDHDGAAVRAMSATLRHRGPDDEGLHADARAGVSIGVRRLAILDLPGGHQPLANEDGSVWVVFNGEIYNYPQLRQQLRARGHRFATSCDTEILVHLYEEFGEAMVHALEGMFAFALWDERRQRLLLARDRFGEKPLFVHESAGELLFASELTALLTAKPGLRELDPAAVDSFFVLGYVPGPGTIVPGVRQLPPGCLLTWERGRGAEQRRWWAPPGQPCGHLREPFGALVAEAERLFTDSVRSRMIADVPVGVFLSGGIDSTLVTSAAAQASSQRVKTFTIGYDVGSFDETTQARRVAHRLDTDHHEVVLTEAEVGARAPAMLASLDQPLADQALISLHALSEFARPLVTVALGGEGADELFGGYPRYRWIDRAGRLESALPLASRSLGGLARRSARWSGAGRALERAAPAPLLERHLDWVTGGRRHRRQGLYGPRLAAVGAGRILDRLDERAGPGGGPSPGRRLMRLDQVDYLPDDVLVKTDRASMLASLEIRTVYLHRGLAEFAASTDTSLHLGGRGKTLLHAMLPPGMDTPRRPSRFRKAAFRAPTAEWLRGPLAPALRDQVRSGMLYEQGWFDRAATERLLHEHVAGAEDHSDVLWPLLALGLWSDRIFGRDGG